MMKFEIRKIDVALHVMELCTKQANTWCAMLQAEFEAEKYMDIDPHCKESVNAALEYHRLAKVYSNISHILRSYPEEMVERFTV